MEIYFTTVEIVCFFLFVCLFVFAVEIHSNQSNGDTKGVEYIPGG